MPNPLDNYKPRDWSVYTISIEEGQNLPTEQAGNDLLVCASDSQQAIALAAPEWYDPSKMFFSDFEQLSAGHNLFPHGPLLRLTGWYRDHAPGKLAFITYEAMGEDPPQFTIFLEK